MLLYSKTITSFIKKIKARSRTIMAQEMGLSFKSSRFTFGTYSYPLHFVVFEDDNKLGFFRSDKMQIALNKKLMLLTDEHTIDQILRHELAHLYTYLKYPNDFHSLDSHGKEYRQVCLELGWDKDIYSAKINLHEKLPQSTELDEISKKYDKIKKLLKLASSDNLHEAKQATQKANQLLYQYNLESLNAEDLEDQTSYVKTVLVKKKSNPIFQAIYDILGHFYVQPVFSRNQGATSLEVVGTKQNVELADYIAKFLDNELERFWQLARKQDPALKGAHKKRSYIHGLSLGFIEKLEQNQPHQQEHALINNNLAVLTQMAFPRLSRSYTRGSQICTQASKTGYGHGQSLNIRPGLHNKQSTKYLG